MDIYFSLEGIRAVWSSKNHDRLLYTALQRGFCFARTGVFHVRTFCYNRVYYAGGEVAVKIKVRKECSHSGAALGLPD